MRMRREKADAIGGVVVRSVLVAALAVAGAVAGCTPADDVPEVVVTEDDSAGVPVQRVVPDPAMVRDVTAALQAWVDAVSAMDGPALRAGSIADDRFAWLEAGGVRFRSADDLLADLEARPAPTTVETELSGIEVVPVGRDAAHAWAEFMTSISEGAGTYTYEGVKSFVLERRDGAWRVVAVHTSEVPPLLEPEADSLP